MDVGIGLPNAVEGTTGEQLGEQTASFIAGSAAKDAETVRGHIQGFEGVGCDELVLLPCFADPGQADLLADAAGL
ncbi:MAG: hypothetical protein JST31_09355 [Actinobacteria bacterium]|nr:hypothetical protein [Actinomycetota bacterium]